MPEAVVQVAEVKAFQTKSGNVRYVLRDADGNEYTTFREEIARTAVAAEGKRARIEFHEQQRGEFTNVYLDKVEALPEDDEAQASSVDEVAWKTAMDAAPYLLPGDAVEREIPADELFEKLQPFKDRVAEDIESSD
ncbi:MAG: hypothetical protein ACJ74P_02250 [Gaiellaceae bacterium]